MKALPMLSAIALAACGAVGSTHAFEGRIAATLNHGGQSADLLYTAGKGHLRIEKTDTTRPHARNLVNLQTGELTLIFPHNRSFTRLKAPVAEPSRPDPGVGGPAGPAAMVPPGGPSMPPGVPAAPGQPPMPPAPGGMPPDIGPQMGGMPGSPAAPPMTGMAHGMPPIAMMEMEMPELKATGEKSELLGHACEKFEIEKDAGRMEIWATRELLPFHPWLRNQPHRVGPRLIEEEWGTLLRAKGLFPLLAVLKSGSGPERLRFEVKSITPETIADPDGELFQAPSDYHELAPLPF